MKSEMPRSLGRYEIVRELGKGAMGVVYEGRDPVLGRRVAIKTARRDVLETSGMADELMARFLREARSAGAINHPNVITIYDAGEEGDTAYMAMEFIDSGTLYDRLCDGGRMSPEEAVKIGAAICEALAAAHDGGVVHRDVKPANIMLMPDDTVKVADFGIARVSDSKLTQEGVMVGTPQYMSPEQFMGMPVDGRSDLFSAAVIVYEMLTGEHPFPAHGVTAIMHQVIKVEPVAPRELNVAVNDNLSDVVVKALEKSPNRRYQDGRLMGAALREALKENPDPAVLGLASPGHADAGAPTVLSRAGAATAVSEVRPDGTAPAPEAGPAAQRPRRKRLSRRIFLTGGGAVVAVAAGVALIVTSLIEPGRQEAAGSVAGYEGVMVMAFLAKSAENYDDAVANGPSQENCEVDGTADISIESQTGETLHEPANDTAVLEFKEPSPQVTISVSREGYETVTRTFQAKEGDAPFLNEVVILKPLE